MAEILGPALNLRFYETTRGFDVPGLLVDLKYFIREHGSSVVKAVLPSFPHEALTRLQYAPDSFSYHLVDGKLVAGEDLKNNHLVDAQTRVDNNEPRRGTAAYHILGRLRSALEDENVKEGHTVGWLSPKEGFGPHAYLNVGVVDKDDIGRRCLRVSGYMSDFSQSELLRIVQDLSGVAIPFSTDPKLVARILFSCNSADVPASCLKTLGDNCSIEGIPISRLWEEESTHVWSAIRRVVKGGERKILDVIASAEEKIARMQTGLAHIVFGFIGTVLGEIDGRQLIDFHRPINERSLMAAFATAIAGCIGFGLMDFPGQLVSAQAAFGGESNRVHCPNCNKTVSCAVGEPCPGCRQVRPC